MLAEGLLLIFKSTNRTNYKYSIKALNLLAQYLIFFKKVKHISLYEVDFSM